MRLTLVDNFHQQLWVKRVCSFPAGSRMSNQQNWWVHSRVLHKYILTTYNDIQHSLTHVHYHQTHTRQTHQLAQQNRTEQNRQDSFILIFNSKAYKVHTYLHLYSANNARFEKCRFTWHCTAPIYLGWCFQFNKILLSNKYEDFLYFLVRSYFWTHRRSYLFVRSK